jgi:hypothetical protein
MTDQDCINRQLSLWNDAARVAVGGNRGSADARLDFKEAVSSAQIVSAEAAGRIRPRRSGLNRLRPGPSVAPSARATQG